MQILSNKFAANRVSLKQQRAELDAQARFLEGEAANNRELEARLGLAEREVRVGGVGGGGRSRRLGPVMLSNRVPCTLKHTHCFVHVCMPATATLYRAPAQNSSHVVLRPGAVVVTCCCQSHA